MVHWDAPWNGVRVDWYLVWDHVTFKEYKTKETFLRIEHENTQQSTVWVRSETNGIISAYSKKTECKL